MKNSICLNFLLSGFRPMFKTSFSYINEEFYAEKISSRELDALLAGAWRHFGTQFYRYSLGVHDGELRFVLPLRVRLADFAFSASQRRVLRKNQRARVVFRPIEVTQEKHDLFEKHKRRFKTGVPHSLYDFLSREPSSTPCAGLELCVYENEKLLAVSFLDVGNESVSGIYTMFEPDETSRSLGIFTMLQAIKFGIENDKKFYYPGYAYQGNSFYDYKKRLRPLEMYNWRDENWLAYPEGF